MFIFKYSVDKSGNGLFCAEAEALVLGNEPSTRQHQIQAFENQSKRQLKADAVASCHHHRATQIRGCLYAESQKTRRRYKARYLRNQPAKFICFDTKRYKRLYHFFCIFHKFPFQLAFERSRPARLNPKEPVRRNSVSDHERCRINKKGKMTPTCATRKDGESKRTKETPQFPCTPADGVMQRGVQMRNDVAHSFGKARAAQGFAEANRSTT